MSPTLLLLAGVLVASDPGEIPLDNGVFGVTVSSTGVLVAGPAPPHRGLHTLDGPRLLLEPEFAEWLGLAFDVGDERVEAAASGRAADWADRTALIPVSMESTGDEARIVTRVDDVEIHTTFHFDRDQPNILLASVELHNRGSLPLRNVLVCREWRTGGSPSQAWTFPYDIRGVGAAPSDIYRLVWMTDDVPPGDHRGCRLSYRTAPDANSESDVRRGVDVPLQLWTNADFPTGLIFGATNGISIGDYDADGFIDVFACQSGSLWRNVGGTTWSFAQDLDTRLPPTTRRYGSSFGDYNEDGLPDIGTEPRKGFGGDECYHLLKNLGGDFVDVATDPTVLDTQPCGADSETLCWADVDGDGFMDAFLPVYPAWAGGGPGNFFMQNLGPTGPGEAYRFTENVDDVGLDNPPGTARSEGAQFVDLDFDGDVELYCNGTLYQNNSSVGAPSFEAMSEAASGIGLSTSLEEGAAFVDYDLDGDQDLLIVYTNEGVRIYDGLGDGMHEEADQSIIESPFTGLNLGLSAEDWDNDGDIDFTTRDVFRQNMFVETGMRRFTVASTSIPASHRTSATPSWGDWDKDGDLDCVLGNWLSVGRFYENTAADAIPPADRRYVRVKVLREDDAVSAGREAEYGAMVEIHVAGETGVRRRKFVASSHGYLNQNEYALHFALPEPPAQAGGILRFDVTVDFPNPPAGTMWRVDKYVNPALGGIDLAALTNRELQVFRNGVVVRNDVSIEPTPVSPIVITTTQGLATPTADTPLSAPEPSPTGGWHVGLAFDTALADRPVRVKEVMLDGQLDSPPNCPAEFNVAFWDVTDPDVPVAVDGGLLHLTTSPRNHRSYFRTDVVLVPQRTYRLIARVTAFRTSPVVGLGSTDAVTVLGGVGYTSLDPCTGIEAAAAAVNASEVPLAIRYSEDPGAPVATPEVATVPATTRFTTSRPNPTHGATTWGFRLVEAGRIEVLIFDVTGRRVRTVMDAHLSAGAHAARWDGHLDGGSEVANGTYFVALRVDGRTLDTRRIVLIR